MTATLHSFMDFFGAQVEIGKVMTEMKAISIPMIQRDYAQGRTTPEVERIRTRFLDSLYKAVNGQPITLDFVYGNVDKNGVLEPLDGQQRLTTLFLLHWYSAKKENISNEEYAFLKNFGYETRYSVRNFCNDLIKYVPKFDNIDENNTLSKDIENQTWFPLDWKKDPSVSSMLVMLDAIDERFRSVDGLWDSLKNGAITFYFLPLKDFEMSDDLYIKMNSRGKPLTLFEHFKAELEREIRKFDESLASSIGLKIDREWTNLLWQYRDSGKGIDDDFIIDDEFLRYFWFICDIICYKNGLSPQGRSNDVFDLIKTYFSDENKDARANINLMTRYFDCWIDIKGYNNPSEFLNSLMSYEHETDKIVIDKTNKNYQIDILEDCLHSYGDKNGRVREFPLRRILLLYAIISYLLNQQNITESDFRRRIRIVNNLIKNSQDEISDRVDGNRIPAILQQIDSIIIKGTIDGSIDINFNANQLEEEKLKQIAIAVDSNISDVIYRLEDHHLLRGQIAIVGLDNLNLAKKFDELFNCDLDKVDCALIATGDYGQKRNNERYQYGSAKNTDAWRELFHKSRNLGFENTKQILVELLSTQPSFDDTILQSIADAYLHECEQNMLYPWSYYYVKYKVCRPGLYGKLDIKNKTDNPYIFTILMTKSYMSTNSYIPYFKIVDSDHVSRESLGQILDYNDSYIACENAAFVQMSKADDSEIARMDIPQSNGIDTVNRVEKLEEFLVQRGLHS